jgi:protein-S-isoprenylcysteine O-methyltransferase Ste14
MSKWLILSKDINMIQEKHNDQGEIENNHKIMPTTYFTVLLFLSIGSHIIYPMKIIQFPYTYAGILLIIIGVALNVWTDALFKKAHTTVKPHLKPKILITSGPFQISRHPMYLGMMTALLGVAIYLGSPIPFTSPIIYILLMERFFIYIEERNLESSFGDKYLNYKTRVRRWI